MTKAIILFFIIGIICPSTSLAQPNQVNISRIDLMGNEPTPYLLRDWAQVASRYDTFVYDINKTGQYLPFCTWKNVGLYVILFLVGLQTVPSSHYEAAEVEGATES